jgi:hypothetical protein
VSKELAVAAFSLRDELENVGRLLRAVWRMLDGYPAETPPLNPPTPIRGESVRIEQETVSLAEARAWLAEP